MKIKMQKKLDPGHPQSGPKKIKGIRHILAAFRYSMAGAKRLSEETAFFHEALYGIILFFGLLILGAPLHSLALTICMTIVTFAIEAINTAIELIIDRTSPEFSHYAKNAKDLGSFAVFCLLSTNAIYCGVVAYQLY